MGTGLLRLGAVTCGALALCVGAASAGPGLIIGTGDDGLKWTEATGNVVKAHQEVGLNAVRVTLHWRQGLTRADDDGRTHLRRAQNAARLGHRVVLGIFGDPSGPPVTAEQREQYCQFVRDALSRARAVQDVTIWNEANSAVFWKPQKGAAALYAALLAHCYDTLHSYRRTVNVISTTAPRENPAKFIAELGAAYRAMGRDKPIFDTFGHNVYPEYSSESPLVVHPGLPVLDQGDYVRLIATLTTAFRDTAQPVPGSGSITIPATGTGFRARPAIERPVTIWYLETGFETVVPAEKRGHYTGKEPNRRLVQPLAPKTRSALVVPDQVSQLRDALELAYCQPAVGAFFNFMFVDEVGLGGWQSGLLWADGTPKPSFDGFKTAVAAVLAGTVDCNRFPVAVTGPRPAATATTTTSTTATTTTAKP
jgi:hypothetical protein